VLRRPCVKKRWLAMCDGTLMPPHWIERIGAVLAVLDPAEPPLLVVDQLWAEVRTWGCIDGIWLHCRSAHLQPAGTALAGKLPDQVERIEQMALNTTLQLDARSVARQLNHDDMPVAALAVVHDQASDAAAFLIEALSRYCLDRLRLQLEVAARATSIPTLQAAVAHHVHLHGPNLGNCFREIERELITQTLIRERGIKLRAAAALGINRMTLDRKLAEYGIAAKRRSEIPT